jgi:hypothetical protein
VHRDLRTSSAVFACCVLIGSIISCSSSGGPTRSTQPVASTYVTPTATAHSDATKPGTGNASSSAGSARGKAVVASPCSAISASEISSVFGGSATSRPSPHGCVYTAHGARISRVQIKVNDANATGEGQFAADKLTGYCSGEEYALSGDGSTERLNTIDDGACYRVGAFSGGGNGAECAVRDGTILGSADVYASAGTDPSVLVAPMEELVSLIGRAI